MAKPCLAPSLFLYPTARGEVKPCALCHPDGNGTRVHAALSSYVVVFTTLYYRGATALVVTPVAIIGLFAPLLFMDLDRFKVINDSMGHEMGNRPFVSVGERLLSCVRGRDTVAPLGGDEYTTLLAHLGSWLWRRMRGSGKPV